MEKHQESNIVPRRIIYENAS